MQNELMDELWKTLRQIGPATLGEVVSDVRGRVRLGLLLLVSAPATSDLELSLVAAWQDLVAAGAIEDVGERRYACRPLAAIATGDEQLRLFV